MFPDQWHSQGEGEGLLRHIKNKLQETLQHSKTFIPLFCQKILPNVMEQPSKLCYRGILIFLKPSYIHEDLHN